MEIVEREFAADLLQASKWIRDSVKEVQDEVRHIKRNRKENNNERENLKVVGTPALDKKSGEKNNGVKSEEGTTDLKHSKATKQRRRRDESKTTERDNKEKRSNRFLREQVLTIQKRLRGLWATGRWDGLSLRVVLDAFGAQGEQLRLERRVEDAMWPVSQIAAGVVRKV